MKKYVLITAVMSLVSTQVFAQTSALDHEVDAELDQMYSTRQAPQGGTSAGVANNANQGPTQGGQPIYIMNQATPTAQTTQSAQQIQKQPTTYIEASPLNKSRADQIREARQQAESETESKIVEKLEQSRIEDEKRRATVLFGERFDNMNQPAGQPAPLAPVVVAPVAAPAPVPVAVVEKENTREVVREEIRAALDEKKEVPTEVVTKKYFSGIAGIGEYPDVKNVRGNYVLGAAFGTKFEETYAVEGGFTYSNYTVQKLDGFNQLVPDQYGNWYYVPRLVDVQQYAVSLAVKYYLLSGMVKPILGGIAQYSYRTFSWSSDNYAGYSSPSNSSGANSHAIDLGILTGADFEMSPKFTLGADFRYMFNLSSRVNTDRNSYFLSHASYGTPIEKLQYYNLSLVARVSF